MLIDHICIIDDNTNHIKALSLALKSLFITVPAIRGEKQIASFNNPDGVMQWLSVPTFGLAGQDLRPNIIFLDLRFDTVRTNIADGYETIVLLRNHQKTRNSFIIACTGDAFTDETYCVSKGFSFFIRKPVTNDKLRSALEIYKKTSES